MLLQLSPIFSVDLFQTHVISIISFCGVQDSLSRLEVVLLYKRIVMSKYAADIIGWRGGAVRGKRRHKEPPLRRSVLLCYLYNYPSPCCLPGFAISSSATFPLWTLIPQHELTFPSFHPGIVVRFCVQERATEYYTDMYSYLSTEDPSSSKWWKYSLTASAVRACLR